MLQIPRYLGSLMLIGFLSAVSSFGQSTQPPVAPVIPHTEIRFGITVVDNYYWLRDKSNAKVITYLENENAYTEAMTKPLKPFEAALYSEILSHIQQTDLTVPVRRGDYLYYSRTEEGKQYPIQCRKKGSPEAKEEVLLDLNELGQGKKFVGLGVFVVSDDQNLLAYTIDYVGYRQFSLRVKDLRTGATLPDTLERVDSLAWAADSSTLFLTTEDEVTKRANRVWRHALGQKDFEPLYEEKDETFQAGIDKTRDKKYLLLYAASSDTTEFRYLKSDQPKSGFTLFLRAKSNTAISSIIARIFSIFAATRMPKTSRFSPHPKRIPIQKTGRSSYHTTRMSSFRTLTCFAILPFPSKSPRPSTVSGSSTSSPPSGLRSPFPSPSIPHFPVTRRTMLQQPIATAIKASSLLRVYSTTTP